MGLNSPKRVSILSDNHSLLKLLLASWVGQLGQVQKSKAGNR